MKQKLSFTFLLITMGISLRFSSQFLISDLWLPHFIIIGLFTLFLFYGLWKLEKNSHKVILSLSTVYYLLMVLNTLNKAVTSLVILLPLVFIPIFTSITLNNRGLVNRMAYAFWAVVFSLITKTIYPPSTPYMMALIVGISYYLQITQLFYSSFEGFNLQEMVWYNVKERNPNIDYSNSTHLPRED